MLIIGQYIYLAGGQKGKQTYRKSIERFDLLKHKWKIIGSMSSRGAGIACSYVPVSTHNLYFGDIFTPIFQT